MGNKVKSVMKSSTRQTFFDGASTGSQTHQVLVEYSRAGSDNPAWKNLVKASRSATTGVNTSIRNVEFHGTTITGLTRNHPNERWKEIRVVNPEISASYLLAGGGSLISRVSNECDAKFFKQLRETQRSISGPTFLGELRSSLRMLKRPASALRDFTMSHVLKQKRLRDIKGDRLTRALAQQYLEYQFGVKPLLQDTADAARAVAALIDKIRYETVYARKRDVEGTIVPYAGGVGNFVLTGENQLNWDCSFSARAGLRAQAKSPARKSLDELSRWREEFGFTLSEFVPTIYELIPYSFVVDYFTNVGDVLTAITTDTSSVTWYSKGGILLRTNTCVRNVVAEASQLRSVAQQSAGGWKTSYAEVTRTGTLSYPSLTIGLPGIKQVANLSALFLALRSR